MHCASSLCYVAYCFNRTNYQAEFLSGLESLVTIAMMRFLGETPEVKRINIEHYEDEEAYCRRVARAWESRP